MVVKKLYNGISSCDETMLDEDVQILAKIFQNNTTEEIVNILNEYRYGERHNWDFKRTEGGDVGRVRGFLKSIPSIAVSTLISPSMTILAGIGALHARLMQRWDDKHRFLNNLDPRYWVDYVATRSDRDKKSRDKFEKDDKKSKETKETNNTTVVAPVAVNIDADDEHQEMTLDEFKSAVKSQECVPYWVTLSNGETMRLHADSEETAGKLADFIISKTMPIYKKLNEAIHVGCACYMIYFDDGEIMYWAGKAMKRRKADEDDAIKAATKQREALTNAMNSGNDGQGVTVIPKLDAPNVVKISIKRLDDMPIPEPKKHKSISKTQPRFNTERKRLPEHVYESGDLYQYRAKIGCVVINFPATSQSEAVMIAKKFIERSNSLQQINTSAGSGHEAWSIGFGDGDRYYIAETQADAKELANKLFIDKKNIIEETLSSKNADEYFNIYENYKDELVKMSASLIDRDQWAKKIRKFPTKAGVCRLGSGSEVSEKITFDLHA